MHFLRKKNQKRILANTMYLQIISKYFVFADLYISKYYVFADYKQILRICRSFFLYIYIYICISYLLIYSKSFFSRISRKRTDRPLTPSQLAASRGQSLIFRFSEVSGMTCSAAYAHLYPYALFGDCRSPL